MRPPNEIVEANVRRYALAKRMPLDAVAVASTPSTATILALSCPW